MLSCTQLTEILIDYLERRMPFAERTELRLHLMMCQDCTAYVQQTKLAIRVLGKLPAEPMPQPMRDVLLEHYRKRVNRNAKTPVKA